MVTTLTLETQFGEDGYTQFRVIVVIEPQTNTQTDSGGRLQYTAPQLIVYSVINTDRYRENRNNTIILLALTNKLRRHDKTIR